MDTQHNEGKTEKVTVYLPVNFKEPESISGVPNFYLDEFVNGKWEPKCYVKPAQGYFSEFEPSTLPPPVSRTAEEIEQMAYEIYPHDVPIESPGDQCKNFHYRQAYISGFKKAMELYRTQPEEREERVRIAGEAEQTPPEIKNYLESCFVEMNKIYGPVKKVAVYGGSAFAIYEGKGCYKVSFQSYNQNSVTLD